MDIIKETPKILTPHYEQIWVDENSIDKELWSREMLLRCIAENEMLLNGAVEKLKERQIEA